MPALQRARVTQRSATGTLTFRSAVLLGCMTAFALLTLFVRIRTGEEVRDATQEYKESEIDSSYSTLVSQGQRRLIDEPQSHQRGIPGAGQQDAADQGGSSGRHAVGATTSLLRAGGRQQETAADQWQGALQGQQIAGSQPQREAQQQPQQHAVDLMREEQAEAERSQQPDLPLDELEPAVASTQAQELPSDQSAVKPSIRPSGQTWAAAHQMEALRAQEAAANEAMEIIQGDSLAARQEAVAAEAEEDSTAVDSLPGETASQESWDTLLEARAGQAQAVSSQARPRSEFTTGQKEWSDGTLNGVPLETTAKPGAGDASEEQYEPDPYNPRCLGAPRPWLFAQPPPTHYDPPPPPVNPFAEHEDDEDDEESSNSAATEQLVAARRRRQLSQQAHQARHWPGREQSRVGLRRLRRAMPDLVADPDDDPDVQTDPAAASQRPSGGAAEREGAAVHKPAAQKARPAPQTSRKGNGFASAGKGGKHGMSCAAEAPQKSRQACAEQRALDRCAAEERNADIRSPAEEALALCLKDMKQCTSKIPELAATARELQGMRMLLASRPACLLAHSAGGCAPLTANNETGLYMGGCGERGGGPADGCNMDLQQAPLLAEDVGGRFATCAVVGNNLNLFERPNGRSIDAHHAVFRFNNEVERMVTAVDAKQEWDDSRTADHLGGATTFRFLNRKYTLDMLGKALPEELLMADHVVFWHYFSLPYLARLQDKYPELPLAVLAPDLVNWQLAVFSQLRSDLYRLGLGPFDCYRMLSSGAHGLLMSILMCDRVDIYGFSVTMDAFEAGFHHQRPSESHSWGFETLLLRLLYLAGVTDVCNV